MQFLQYSTVGFVGNVGNGITNYMNLDDQLRLGKKKRKKRK